MWDIIDQNDFLLTFSHNYIGALDTIKDVGS